MIDLFGYDKYMNALSKFYKHFWLQCCASTYTIIFGIDVVVESHSLHMFEVKLSRLLSKISNSILQKLDATALYLDFCDCKFYISELDEPVEECKTSSRYL